MTTQSLSHVPLPTQLPTPPASLSDPSAPIPPDPTPSVSLGHLPLVTSGVSFLDPDVPSFLPNAASNSQVPRKTRSRKENIKDLKEVEIDFLKRELNIAKVHLLEYETELNDLKKKNKVLTETVSILENDKQSELYNRYATSATAPTPRRPTTDASKSSSPYSNPGTTSNNMLEPNLINKLLHLLSDLVKRFSDISNHSIDSHNLFMSGKTQQASKPPASTPASSTTSSSSTNKPRAGPQVTPSQSPTTNLSLNSLDEFASDLSMELSSPNVISAPGGQVLHNLNFQVPTTQ